MEDRFKFRVWVKEYTEDYDDEGTFVHYEGWHDEPLHFLLDPEPEKGLDYTIQQCTGLKDKNGKLVFEGDIIQVNPVDRLQPGACQGQVVWLDLAWQLKRSEHIDVQLPTCFAWGKVEIIGNIFENKDLLGDA